MGTGEDLTIAELAEMVRRIVHPKAAVTFDRSKPDGTPRKLLDVSRLHALGWQHTIQLSEGIESTYRWFVANHVAARSGRSFRTRMQRRVQRPALRHELLEFLYPSPLEVVNQR